jgi:hypothetical protein
MLHFYSNCANPFDTSFKGRLAMCQIAYRWHYSWWLDRLFMPARDSGKLNCTTWWPYILKYRTTILSYDQLADSHSPLSSSNRQQQNVSIARPLAGPRPRSSASQSSVYEVQCASQSYGLAPATGRAGSLQDIPLCSHNTDCHAANH